MKEIAGSRRIKAHLLTANGMTAKDVNLEEAREFTQKIKLLSKIKVITHISGKRTIREAKIEKPKVLVR